MTAKVQRNDPCPCGSGKKYKKCCLNNNAGTLKGFRFRLFGAIAVMTIFIASFIYTASKNQETSYQGNKILDIKRTLQAQRFPVNKVQLSKEEIIKYELPTLNLIAAQGLSGAENLDIRSCLTTLNKWADRVSSETQKYFPRFYENPNDYNNSEAYFRMLVLITVLDKT